MENNEQPKKGPGKAAAAFAMLTQAMMGMSIEEMTELSLDPQKRFDAMVECHLDMMRNEAITGEKRMSHESEMKAMWVIQCEFPEIEKVKSEAELDEILQRVHDHREATLAKAKEIFEAERAN